MILLNLLEGDVIEAAFVRSPFKFQERFEYIEIVQDNLVAAALPWFFEDSGDSIALHTLAKYPLVTNNRWQSYFTTLFTSNSLKANYKIVCEDNRTALFFASKGMGVAIVPESLVSQTILEEKVSIKRINGAVFTTGVYLVYKKHHNFPPHTQECINLLRKCFHG